MLAVPVAPAFFFGFSIGQEVYGQVLSLTQITLAAALAAIVIGLFSAAGLELVGIMSGHLAVKLWGQEKPIKAAICALIMVAYVGLGISGLESLLQKGVVMFLIAPLVYFLVGIKEQAERDEQAAIEEMERIAAAEAASQEDERQKEAEAEAWQRKLQLAELKLKHEEKLARIEAKAKQPPASSQSTPQKSRRNSVKLYECVCGRVLEGSRSYSAHRRHCEVPANKPARIYENGNY